MLTLDEAAGRVPVFTQMKYADLSARFRSWLALDHGLNDALAERLASIMFDRRQRYCWCEE